MRALVLVTVLAVATACSSGDEEQGKSETRTVHLTVQHEANMQVGNLIQKVLDVGDPVEALCFATAPEGYPGPVAQVQSGPTIGYVTVEADGTSFFDVPANELRERLPDCGPTGLM